MLDLPIVYGPTMSPVCLPPQESADLHVGRAAAVVGWGALKEGTLHKNLKLSNMRLLIIRYKSFRWRSAECSAASHSSDHCQ